MKGLRLYKCQKLCSRRAIEALYDRRNKTVGSALAYPLRAAWQLNGIRGEGACPQFLITVPKKRLRHAVDRVLMRRRIREAYRLNHGAVLPQHMPIDIAFVYVADAPVEYHRVEKAMHKLLQIISEYTTENHATQP